MERIYLLTGANGHLGRTIVHKLLLQGARVRALVLPGDKAPELEQEKVEIVRGDVRDAASLAPLFRGLSDLEVVVIHAAAVIDISSKVSKQLYDVNVTGTKNMVGLALAHKVYRFIYVSSVHAIPEAPLNRQIGEVKQFSPQAVHGGYAKTKAEAAQFVMDSIHHRGLPGIVLHPSGIIGPGDAGTNNLVAAVRGYWEGRIAACPSGGYNLVDVRDVADAVVAAADKGRVGETYILSGKHYSVRSMFAMVRDITGKGKRCPHVPGWMGRLAAPVFEYHAQRRKQKPLVTPYSLSTLTSNDNFTHEKASRELGFWPRDFYVTLKDTLDWLAQAPETKKPKARKRLVRRRRQVHSGA